MSRHLSVRVDEDVLARLDAESRRVGRSRSWLAKQLLDEGLRMERHPGVMFRTGPAGRRAGLIGGPDVWDVVRACLGHDLGDAAVRREIGDRTGLTADQVRAALRYYAEYSGEVDEWIRRVDEAAEQAEAAWRGERELLHR